MNDLPPRHAPRTQNFIFPALRDDLIPSAASCSGCRRVQIEAIGVDEVFFSGDFNRWKVPGHPMIQISDTTWEMTLDEGQDLQLVGCFGYVQGRITWQKFFHLNASCRTPCVPAERTPLINQSQLDAGVDSLLTEARA